MAFEDFDDVEVPVLAEEDVNLTPPDGTVANVQVRVDAESGEYAVVKHEGSYGPFLVFKMETVGGEFGGTWCDYVLNLDARRRGMRAVQELMGVDVENGGQPQRLSEIVRFMCETVFEAELGVRDWEGREGPMKSSTVKRLIAVADAVAAPAAEAAAEPVAGGPDDDMPF